MIAVSTVQICNQVFIAMPFARDFDPIWKAIREVCLRYSLYAYRADQVAAPGDITAQIIAAIEQSLFIVADLSGGNVNVAFEVGYGCALAKDLVLLVDDVDSLPFDFRNLRAIEYDREALDRLQAALARSFDHLVNGSDSSTELDAVE